MTRRALFARLAGLMGVPYVAKALPVPVTDAQVLAFKDAYLRAAVSAIAADIDKRAAAWYETEATRGTGLSDIFKGDYDQSTTTARACEGDEAPGRPVSRLRAPWRDGGRASRWEATTPDEAGAMCVCGHGQPICGRPVQQVPESGRIGATVTVRKPARFRESA